MLFGAGLIAGAINALAGGGSFILFPALLAAGVPPIMANATNTFSSMPGYVSGAVGYWRDILKNRHLLVPYLAAALIGGYAGAEVLLRVSDKQFSIVVPWLMAVAVVLFAFGERINGWARGASGSTPGRAKAIAFTILGLLGLVCFYGGFFNAGLGILLLAFLALAGLTDIHAMNGLKLLLSSVVSAIAVARFALSGSIAWPEGSAAFVGTLVGGYAAARLAHLVPTPALRAAIIVYGVGLTAYFFWTVYAAV